MIVCFVDVAVFLVFRELGLYDCSFCRCRSLSCVQGVRMIDDCLFCRCRGLSCVHGVLLRCR